MVPWNYSVGEMSYFYIKDKPKIEINKYYKTALTILRNTWGVKLF